MHRASFGDPGPTTALGGLATRVVKECEQAAGAHISLLPVCGIGFSAPRVVTVRAQPWQGSSSRHFFAREPRDSLLRRRLKKATLEYCTAPVLIVNRRAGHRGPAVPVVAIVGASSQLPRSVRAEPGPPRTYLDPSPQPSGAGAGGVAATRLCGKRWTSSGRRRSQEGRTLGFVPRGGYQLMTHGGSSPMRPPGWG